MDVKNTADFYNKVAERCSFKQLKQDYVKRDKGGVLFRKGKYEQQDKDSKLHCKVIEIVFQGYSEIVIHKVDQNQFNT